MAKETLDRMGRSELHYAAVNGNDYEVRRLIRAGADVNLRDKDGSTPLHCAAQLAAEQHMLEVAKILIAAGADVNGKDRDGNSPLFKAVYSCRGKGELIRLLREKGADPFAKNNYNISPIELARGIDNFNIAQYFDDLPSSPLN
jgi:ankyrin repeat protein